MAVSIAKIGQISWPVWEECAQRPFLVQNGQIWTKTAKTGFFSQNPKMSLPTLRIMPQLPAKKWKNLRNGFWDLVRVEVFTLGPISALRGPINWRNDLTEDQYLPSNQYRKKNWDRPKRLAYDQMHTVSDGTGLDIIWFLTIYNMPVWCGTRV